MKNKIRRRIGRSNRSPFARWEPFLGFYATRRFPIWRSFRYWPLPRRDSYRFLYRKSTESLLLCRFSGESRIYRSLPAGSDRSTPRNATDPTHPRRWKATRVKRSPYWCKENESSNQAVFWSLPGTGILSSWQSYDIHFLLFSGASGKFMQLSATWRCPIDGGADVCDVGPRQMDDDVCSNKLWRLQSLAQLPQRARSTKDQNHLAVLDQDSPHEVEASNPIRSWSNSSATSKLKSRPTWCGLR